MTTTIERGLAALFEYDAARAPDGVDLLARVQRHQEERAPARDRRRTTAWVAGAALVATAGGVTFVLDDPSRLSPATVAPTAVPSAAPSGPLPDSAMMSCAYTSPDTLEDRQLAFDGTVIAIGESHVRFKINAAFAGVGTSEITVQMSSPSEPNEVRLSEFTPGEYGVGSRFLVSGVLELKPGGEPYAWGCGFTRYWDEATAASWRRTF